MAGGVTTVIDMPLNSDPVTTDIRQLEAKKALAKVCRPNLIKRCLD